jgi:hypothetical protein
MKNFIRGRKESLMQRRTGILIALLVVGMAMQALPAAAQGTTSGTIRGTIADAQGGVLPGATVIATSDALVSGRQVAITSAEGVYRFPSLPPGMYEIEARLDGFQPVLQQNVQLGLGQNINVDLVLGDITISDEIVVMADSVQVSTVSNAASFNLAGDFIERQPISRNPTDLMNYAPGIQNDQAYGAPSTYQNAYNVDGVDVSDPELGSQWVLPSMDWVQEVQVAGLGADAEYGGFTGAVVNLVTKSGGNQFHGDVRAYYSGGSLNSDNAPPGVEGTSSVDSDIDASLSLGGPVIKDQLWYFVSGNRRQRAVEPFFQAGAPSGDREQSDRTESRVLAKLTWQLNQSNKLVGFVDWDDVLHDYRGVGDNVLASGAQKQDSPNYVYSLSWESLITDTSFLTAKLTGYTGSDDRLPYFGDSPNRYDRESQFDWDNLPLTSYKDVDRASLDAAWSLFADGLVTANDSHDFKFGVVYETFESDYVTIRNGGFSYYDDSWYCDSLEDYFADPFCAVFSSDWGGEWDLHGEMDGLHLYAQDAWRVGNLAFNVGVRFTQYTGTFKDVPGDVYDENVWAPRVGFVWDLFGDGRTALKGHFGRYYEGMTITLYDREASGNALSDTLYFDYNFDTGEFDIPAGSSVNAFATMDPSLEHPYVDQFVATFEHQLGRNVLVGVDYIHRETKDINAMLVSNLDDYDVLSAPDNPFGGGSLPFYDLLDEQQYVITNPDDAVRDYDSVALRVRKRYADGWSLDSSLVWSDLTGNTDYGLSGYVGDFEDLNGFTNAQGTLPFNSEWVFKLNASVDLPWRVMLSGFYQFRTGEYWTPYAIFEGLYFNDRTPVYLTPRGSQQYDNRSVLDLRLQKEFGLGGDLALAIFVDAFNVLDSDTITNVREQWGWYVYDYQDHPGGSFWDPSSRFEEPESIQTPREIRIGARFSW